MNTLSIIMAVIATSSICFANQLDNICEGTDREGRQIQIIFDEYTDFEQNSWATIKVKRADRSRITSGLTIYIDNEGGFDYGVTGKDFMFHLTVPPNMLGTDQVAGVFYYDNDFSPNRRVVLKCKKAEFKN